MEEIKNRNLSLNFVSLALTVLTIASLSSAYNLYHLKDNLCGEIQKKALIITSTLSVIGISLFILLYKTPPINNYVLTWILHIGALILLALCFLIAMAVLLFG